MPRFAAALFAAGLIAAIATPATAQEAEEIVGNWVLAVEMPDAPGMADLDVTEEDGVLSATIRSDLGENEIDDIEVLDGQHVLTYMMDMGGQPMDIQITSDVEGDTMAGEIMVSGGAMLLPMQGARQGTDAAEELIAETGRRIAEAQAATTTTADAATTDAATTQTAELGDLTGDWLLMILLPDGVQEANLTVVDTEGELTANVITPLGESEIDDIEVVDNQYVLTWMMDLGGQPMDLQVYADAAGNVSTGTILVGGGAMELGFEGALVGTPEAEALRKKIDEALAQAAEAGEVGMEGENLPPAEGDEAATQPASQPATQPADGDAAGAQPSTPPGRGETTATIGEANIAIDYGRPSTSGPGYTRMAEGGVPEGFVWRLGRNQATKLTTDAPLQFGDTRIEPGSYGLWAKRAGEGWHLLINENADVWGIPYRPDGEIAAVAMDKVEDAEMNEYLEISINEVDEGTGRIDIHWGATRGTVDFDVVD